MKRWLLLALLPVALVLLGVGTLELRRSAEAGPQAVPGEAAACPGDVQTALDRAALIDSLDASPLRDMASAGLSAKCYLVGIDRVDDWCGSDDLYVLRYLCYSPSRGLVLRQLLVLPV